MSVLRRTNRAVLTMYRDEPTEELTLAEFENLALDRLTGAIVFALFSASSRLYAVLKLIQLLREKRPDAKSSAGALKEVTCSFWRYGLPSCVGDGSEDNRDDKEAQHG